MWGFVSRYVVLTLHFLALIPAPPHKSVRVTGGIARCGTRRKTRQSPGEPVNLVHTLLIPVTIRIPNLLDKFVMPVQGLNNLHHSTWLRAAGIDRHELRDMNFQFRQLARGLTDYRIVSRNSLPASRGGISSPE